MQIHWIFLCTINSELAQDASLSSVFHIIFPLCLFFSPLLPYRSPFLLAELSQTALNEWCLHWAHRQSAMRCLKRLAVSVRQFWRGGNVVSGLVVTPGDISDNICLTQLGVKVHKWDRTATWILSRADCYLHPRGEGDVIFIPPPVIIPSDIHKNASLLRVFVFIFMHTLMWGSLLQSCLIVFVVRRWEIWYRKGPRWNNGFQVLFFFHHFHFRHL